MVFYHGIGHEHIGADLAAPGDLLLFAFDIGDLLQVFPLFDLHQFGHQHFHGHFAVLVLAALHLAGNHNAGGDVDQPHRRGGLIDLLAAGAAGPVHFHFDVLRGDLHGIVQLHLGHHFQGSKGGLTSARCVKGGNTHQPVDTRLALQVAVGVFALHHNGSTFQASLIPVQIVQGFHLVAVALRPAVIHPEQHFRPVLGLGAAGPRVEGEDGIVFVVFPGEQGGKLHRGNFIFNGLDLRFGLVHQREVFGLVAHFDQGHTVACAALQPLVGFVLIF